MRTKKSIINVVISFVAYILTILVRFIAQKLFIRIMGIEYLGINGLFTNIISMLSIAELGIGSAIIYNLYKPLKDNNEKKIQALMNFYRKAYYIIALIVLTLGVLLIPILPYIIKDITIDINITFIYLLFILETFSSYLLSYKRSILYADQKNYIINIFDISYLIVLNILQLVVLYITKNYYLYLTIKILCTIIENVCISKYVNLKYQYLKNAKGQVLDKNTEDDIFKKVKALLFHKLGGFIVLGTDNIIISSFIGVIYVGLYSNYYLIISATNNLFGRLTTSLTPSVGNLLVENNIEKNYSVFKRIRFMNNWLTTFSGIVLLVVLQNFIVLWLGEKYLLSDFVLIILIINFYFSSMRHSYTVFKEAAGIYYEDRFVPLIESFLNIVFSIMLIKPFGLAGVFLGTLISGMSLWCYSYPKYVYKKLFGRNYKKYVLESTSYLLLFLILAFSTYAICNIVILDSTLLNFIKNLMISLILPNFVLILLLFKNEDFRYFKQLLVKTIKKLLAFKNKKLGKNLA